MLAVGSIGNGGEPLMRAPRLAALATIALTSALALTACGDDSDSGSDGSDSASEGPVTVHIDIEGGEVTPLGETVEATAGQDITFIVNSDMADEIHVHSDPEQEFEVEPGDDQEFTFSIDDPATYEVESHELGVVIVKLQITE
jgi:plastocyanin